MERIRKKKHSRYATEKKQMWEKDNNQSWYQCDSNDIGMQIIDVCISETWFANFSRTLRFIQSIYPHQCLMKYRFVQNGRASSTGIIPIFAQICNITHKSFIIDGAADINDIILYMLIIFNNSQLD